MWIMCWNKKRVWHYIVLAVLAAVIGLGVFSLNSSRLTGDQMPMPFGVGASVVLSGSMEPELSVGDLLIVTRADSYRVGDVVVYQSGRMAVVHRIISMDGTSVVTQGDANNVPDEPMDVSVIKGKVLWAIPLIGYLVWALKTPAGICMTVAAAVVLMEVSYRSEKKQTESEKEKLKAEIRQLMSELREEDH